MYRKAVEIQILYHNLQRNHVLKCDQMSVHHSVLNNIMFYVLVNCLFRLVVIKCLYGVCVPPYIRYITLDIKDSSTERGRDQTCLG